MSEIEKTVSHFRACREESWASGSEYAKSPTLENLIHYAQCMQDEAEAFRDMVKDNGYVHTVPLDDMLFSWETAGSR